jgi:hypothetical protein
VDILTSTEGRENIYIRRDGRGDCEQGYKNEHNFNGNSLANGK